MSALAYAPPGFSTVRALSLGPAFVVIEVTRGDVRAIAKRPAPRLAEDSVARAMVAREARALRRIGGHGAPSLVAEGADAHGVYLVASFVDGLALDDPSIAIAPRLLAARLFATIAGIHARGVVHGDLSPANVFVHRDDVVLVDFGLARIDDEPEERGAFAGTLRYAAPELAREGRSATTRASDVFTAAALLLERVTGLPCRPALPAAALLVHVAERAVDGAPLAAISPALASALADDPTRRPDAGLLAAAAAAAGP